MVAVMNVVPYTARAAAPPYAAMMPAAWLSTISPAEAARKKTIESRQKTARRRSPSASVTLPVSAEAATPAWATSHALAKPVMARTAAKPPRVARTPKARIPQPNSGAAIIAPAGSRLTM
jgi:hypothetical protein